MRSRLLSRTGSRRRSSSGGGRIACAPRECRPSLANVRPTDRTTPEEPFPPAPAQHCGRRACRAPRKMARRLVAPRQSAAIARHRFRQARSEARTCVACFDTVIDCTVAADWDRSSAAAADTAVDWDRSSAAAADTAVDWERSSAAAADTAVDWDRSSAAAADTAVDWDRSSAAVVDIAVDWNCSSVAEADTAVGRNSSWDQGPRYHTDRMSCRRRPAAPGPVRKNNLDRRHCRGCRRSRDHKRIHKESHNPDNRFHRKIRDRRAARTNVEPRSRHHSSSGLPSIRAVRRIRGGSQSSVLRRNGFRRKNRAGRNRGYHRQNSDPGCCPPILWRDYCARLQTYRRDSGPSRPPVSMPSAACQSQTRSMRIFGALPKVSFFPYI